MTRIDPASTEDLPTIEFSTPMPGFPEHRTFVLVGSGEDEPVFTLCSVDEPALRFIVVPPAPFFPDYAPEIGDQVLEQLATAKADDLLVLLVVTGGDTPAQATANLLAPVVVNRATRRAVQVILSEDLPIRAPLLP
ncbi:MAG TPA: flagellar assembly protein FliW [Actinophytocola sp.]|uniref:flagellar assembly protein FliW n=1 Tax=Actinophytocola sp. TaxID=1872138 RepID=UPI002DB8B0CE|nr:flagellar assembly protein FliW [Actinophytocola sp.]HEU5474198.1 flagellar assembly protein FliW [Actinophytocola sp.]